MGHGGEDEGVIEGADDHVEGEVFDDDDDEDEGGAGAAGSPVKKEGGSRTPRRNGIEFLQVMQ